jgi:hypothetical protein
MLGEPEELLRGGGVLPCGTADQPGWVGEVVERDHGLDTGLPDCPGDAYIAIHLPAVPLATAGDHPTPLDGETIGVDPQVGKQGKVLVRPCMMSHPV